MDTFATWSELKKQDNEAYKLIKKLRHSDLYVSGQMREGGWWLKANPWFVTDAQWARIATRVLSYEDLKSKTLQEVIDSFYYETRCVKVDDLVYYIPSGNIMGWMQGMFMCISANGNINT